MALLRGLKSGLERSSLEGLQAPGDTGPTVFSGSLPNNIGEMSGWTGTSCWTVLHNFSNATLGPLACSAASDSGALSLILIPGGDTSATKTATGQSNYASQTGLNSSTSQAFLFAYASALWKHNATIPTAYIVTMRFDATPSAGDTFYSGIDGGSNSGFWLEAHPTSGVRAAIGVGSGYTYTSYVAGASLYDGEYHTLMLVIDDAAGKAKLFSEFGNTESTGLSIAAGGNTICTIGPLARGYAFNGATYLLSARGEHPLLYTNAQSAFDSYELARTTGSHPAAITALPTTLAELNSVLATITLTNAYNLNSATPAPMAGASGPSLAAFTGTFAGGVPGTPPTVGAAPQVKESFTGQTCIEIDSVGDNLWGAGAMPDLAHTGLLLIKVPNGTHPGSGTPSIVGIADSTTGRTPWSIRSSSSANVLMLESYSNYSGSVQTASASATNLANDGAWRIIAWRRNDTTGAAAHRICVTNPTGLTQATSGGVAVSPIAMTNEGGLGRTYQTPFAVDPLLVSMAMFAWSPTMESNANIEAAVNNLRWRYGL